MVEIFKAVSIDYRQGPEKGVGFQCFPELFSAYEATIVKNEQWDKVHFSGGMGISKNNGSSYMLLTQENATVGVFNYFDAPGP